VRATNQTANHHQGSTPNGDLPRVTGSFTGTTDEILQWAACKWGIDEDIVRAQVAKESWWHQDARGDLTNNQSICDPAVRTGTGTCPESVGLGQVRYQYHLKAFVNDDALLSSSYNVDYTYARWRECYEGGLGWLNTVERGATYAAGDVWGCVGVWFSGRWHTPAAEGYIAAVQTNLSTLVWTTPEFLAG
jgi:autotransporter family porin